jgi:hypothetical protein
MTENAPAAPDGSGGTGYPPPPDCKPDLLDKLKCKAAGVKAQAEYNTAHDAELTKARSDFDTARVQYRTVRTAATKTYEELGTQLEKLLEQLRCLIDDKTTVGLLNEAFDNVKGQLADCGQSGCYLDDDGNFDDLVRCPPSDIAGAIKKIEERITAAKKVFDDLVQEPTELPKRVTSVQADVEAIGKAMASDSRSVDFTALYAKALVAQYHRNNLWRGFVDGRAYVDCLCRALLCQLGGHEAAARLTRRQAVKQCKDDAWAAQCIQLRTHTDVAVLEEYERIKARRQQGSGSAQGGDYGQEGGDYPPQQGGDYPPQQGGDYPPPQQGGGDYPPKQGGDYPPQQGGGGSYPPQQGGGYDDQQDDDDDDSDEEYDDKPTGGAYGRPQGGGPGGGYGTGQPPDQGRG